MVTLPVGPIPLPCNKENMLKFVEALESGNYPQGTGYLLYNGRYCCLGVACEVAIANGVPLVKRQSNVTSTYLFGDSSAFLPKLAREWLGVQSDNPPVIFLHGVHIAATHANDDKHIPFPEIAAGIRELYGLGTRPPQETVAEGK